MTIDRNIALFGTNEAAEEGRQFCVGALTFTLEAGGIRHIRFKGFEVIRGIQYLLRDDNWATPAFSLDAATVNEAADELTVGYRGVVREHGIDFSISAQIKALATGSLEFSVTGRAGAEFRANRIGFSVLHPVPEFEDIPVTVEHLDGNVETSRLPLAVSPSQPLFDIRSLTCSPAQWVEVECRLVSQRPDGSFEPFEMEDQRNWTDASYKTYVGSLLVPVPFEVAAGDVFEQSVTVICTQRGTAPESRRGAPGAARVELGARGEARIPAVGLAIPHHGVEAALEWMQRLAYARPRHLSAYVRADDASLDADIKALKSLSDRLAAPVDLELELPFAHAPGDELEPVAMSCRRVGLAPRSIIACPSDYLKSYQPTAQWPDVPPLEEIYLAARHAFPGARIGGGMLSYFTELNRKWPPRESIDYVSHTVSPIVHAADDITVMENLRSLPAIAATVQKQLEGIEHRLGPSAISMRHNPYGATTLANTDNRRLAMGDADPRERGVFGAAWALGLAAAATQCGIGPLTLFAASGARSILHTPSDSPQPWFDETSDAAVRPVFHVIRGLAALAGRHSAAVVIKNDSAARVAGLAAVNHLGTELWLANLNASKVEIELPASAEVITLDASSFETACRNCRWLDVAPSATGTTIALDSYAVARCRF